MKNIIKHSLPVLMFWVIYFVFVFDGAFREQMKIWYYPVVYGSIGLSMVLYSGYVVVSGRKFRVMVSKINYFAWYCILSGLFMLFLTYVFITTGVHVHEKTTPESSAVTVAVFMCLGVLILLSESFNRFRAQYFPSLRKHTIPKVKQEAPKANVSIPQTAQAQVNEDENFYALEKYFASEPICNPSLTIKDTATALNITQKTLNDQITLYYNTTFAKLLVSKRVDMACKVLRSDDFKNEFDKLAGECGFGSKATFYRNFQQLKGCTPSQFRSSFLNEKKS
ncbi:helix-turn-helix domain-containing protein [Haoranjiania flava]|uniref:AraC family transcriptional regulator n=1 Tax=Haoranjiania flava TaxID=1856322 RepID=A0AAE3IMK6_9BACT|nr:AraC family transcriptional regulator [Haoranjiania flava]MCU7694807.1 AraC family transcriptional regulator [Haoranjiania flava]